MKARLAIALLLVATPAYAQAPTYVPIVIDEAAYKNLRTYLDEVPLKHALPLVQWLEQAEMKARVEAMAKQDKPADQLKP